MNPKVRYELDPHNRLVVKSGRKTGLLKFRKVLDGRFKTDENNNLSYHIKTPFLKDENIPHQVRLRGEWSLTDNHDLRLTLDKQGRRTFGDKITLQGRILDVKANLLLFSLTTKTKENTQSTYVLKLGGSWQADKNNRLSFHARKEKGAYDILTLKGVWQINKHHQIIYQYEKAKLITKKRKTHTLTFKGYWDIKGKARISYELSKNTDSVFRFRAGAGIFKENYIKYELGIGLSARSDPVKQTITLYGRWKVKRNRGILFEIKYRNNETRAIVFGAEARLTDKDTILFKLTKGIDSSDTGISVKLSHKILKGDGEAFLRLLKSKRELAVFAGAAWRW